MGFRIAQATLLTVVMLPCFAAAGQQQEDDREQRTTYSPITASERAAWISGEVVSAGALSSAAFSSAWTMKEHSPKEWPRTASGYGRRFADAQATAAVSSSIEAGLGTLWVKTRDTLVPAGTKGGPALVTRSRVWRLRVAAMAAARWPGLDSLEP